MPKYLSEEIHDNVFHEIKNCFSDFALFEKLVAKQLRKVIADTNNVEIDMKTTRKVTERYFDVDQFQTEQQKLLLTQIQLILKTTYVLILSYHEESRNLMFHSIEELLENYPQFASEDSEELRYLLNFRNYLKIALQIVPARLNKQLLIKIASRLEGSHNEYITGGGQKPCVTRRVLIYENEGNVTKPSKPKNKDSVKNAVLKQQENLLSEKQPLAVQKKRPNNHASLRDVKMIRLPSEEIRKLAQGPADPFALRPNQIITEDVQESPRKRQKTEAPVDQITAPPMGYLSSSESVLSNSLEILENVDELLELCKSDTLIDNIQSNSSVMLPKSIPINPEMPMYSGSLGAISVPSFPPPLQREHSDLLDRLLSDGNPMWTEIVPSNSGTITQTENLPDPTVGSLNESLPAPIQLLRSVSWDVYTGSFTEDLEMYLTNTMS